MKKLLSIYIVLTLVFQFTPTQKVFAASNDATIEVLGGGGGGGVVNASGGGGGGGGEYRRCTETLSVQAYTVTVGAGATEDTTNETDSSFSGTGISMTADGGNGSTNATAGTAGTGGSSTNCDSADANFDGGTPGAGDTGEDSGGGGGGGAGYAGKGGNGATATATQGGGGGGGAGESAAGGDASGVTQGSAGSGGGGVGGNSTAADANGSAGTAGTPATYHIVGGGGGGGSGGPTARTGGVCGAPGAGSGGGEATGGGNGCRGEIRIIYVDSEVDATGGTETTSGIYRIHTFTTSGTFTVNTITLPAIPTVLTQFASNILGTSALLNGTKTGGGDATEHGFAWGTNSGLNGGDTATTTLGAKTSNTAFSSSVTLSTNTTYYFRAYATNTGGTGYGVIHSFYSGNSTATRKMRLYNGAKIKVIGNKLIIRQN